MMILTAHEVIYYFDLAQSSSFKETVCVIMNMYLGELCVR